MSASATTLITFMLRTPPDTISVKLLGSWDNFSKEYSMERDQRIGKDHWRGCHLFTNIVCDGNVNTSKPGRDGGLRMGGTYWYYYKLDNDVDYYNEAEPWTTSCPFLPGQPINVLNVPIHLPSSDAQHKRESSMGSQRSIPQTMNPDDKYMNPRPPPRPKLPRIVTSTENNGSREALTSPVLTSPKGSVPGRSASHPREGRPRRKFRAPGKLTLDMHSAGGSFTKGGSFRSAFHNLTAPRSASKEAGSDRKGYRGNDTGLDTRVGPSIGPSFGSSGQTLQIPTKTHSRGRSLGECEARSRHREISPSYPLTRYPISSPQASPEHLDTFRSTVESFDQSDPPSLVVPCKLDLGSTLDLNEKRLPTLPNSPSSVLDEELQRIGALNSPALDVEVLRSHFSMTTAASEPSPDAFLRPDASHFSEYSTDADATSPGSMTSASTVNNDNNLPSARSFGISEYDESPLIETGLPKLTGLRITNDFELVLPYLHEQDEKPHPDVVTKKVSSDFRISGLHINKKPQTAHEPSTELSRNPYNNLQKSNSTPPTPRASQAIQPKKGVQRPSVHVQTVMQELMDELSYLGDMINVDISEAS